MIMEDRKTRIYFDTNKLECRFNGDNLFLSDIKLSQIFYTVERIIDDLNLKDSVEICIPEVVIMELKKHMIDKYKSCFDSLKSKIEEAKKIFGSLIDIYYEYKFARNLSEYKQYVEDLFNSFIESNTHIVIAKAPKEEKVMNKILKKAVFSEKPFQTAKGRKKDYSDAGFKDALISETIIENSKNLNSLFLTDDQDFKEVFGEYDNIKIMETSDKIEEYLISTYNVDQKIKYFNEFIHNNYLVQTILKGCGYDEKADFKVENLMENKIDEESGEIIFRILACIDGKFDVIFVKYDPVAREIIEYYNEG